MNAFSDDMMLDFQLSRMFEMIAVNVNDVVIVTEAEPIDPPGPRIVYVNPAFERETGYAASEVLNKSPRILSGPNSDPKELKRIRNALEQWRPVRAVVINHKKDGTPYWSELDISPVADESGRYTHWVSIQRNVTEAKRDELLAVKTGAHAPGALFQFQLHADGRSCFPFATAGIIAIFGVTPDEVREDASAALDRIHPDDLGAFRASIERSADDLSPWRMSYRTVLDDGRCVWLRGQATPERAQDGSTLWHGYVSDVTEDHKSAIEESLAKAVFDHCSQAVMVTDHNNKILTVNAEFETITGYALDEIKGRNPNILSAGRQPNEFYQAMWTELKSTGCWRGEIWNRRKSGEVYPEWLTISLIRDNEGAVRNYVAMFSDITEQKATQERINRLAFMDPLTGLANRRLAMDRMEGLISHAERKKQPVAAILVDLDHFKAINDSYGHTVGDGVLVDVSLRLASFLRSDDVLARLGGDEFLIGMAGPDCPDRAVRVAEQVIEVLKSQVVIEGREFHVSPSVGVAMYPADAQNLQSLLQFADQAMYAAKSSGRACFRFFSSSMHEGAMRRIEQEAALRRAVADCAFVLHYQPQVDVQTGKIKAAEALLRCTDKSLGSPAEFVPLAEELGLIHTISDFTLNEACRQMRIWRDQGSEIERVAINISALQFADPQLVEKVERAMRMADIPAAAVELEITETAVMADASRTVEILASLKALGVELAIDDFGTGYSSLAYLRNFPVNRVKVDRAFVSGLETENADVELVRAVVSLARALELETLAEGVETAGQWETLRRLGCQMAQGYLFGRPVPGHMLGAPPAPALE